MSGKANDKCLICGHAGEEERVWCYDCRQWAHRQCTDLSALQFTIVMGCKDSIQWLCRKCASGSGQAEKTQHLQARLDELTDLVRQLSDRIEALEKDYTPVSVEWKVKEHQTTLEQGVQTVENDQSLVMVEQDTDEEDQTFFSLEFDVEASDACEKETDMIQAEAGHTDAGMDKGAAEISQENHAYAGLEEEIKGAAHSHRGHTSTGLNQDIQGTAGSHHTSSVELDAEERAEKEHLEPDTQDRDDTEQTYQSKEPDVKEQADKEETSWVEQNVEKEQISPSMEQCIEEKADQEQTCRMEQNQMGRAEKDQTYPVMEKDIEDTVDKEQTSGMEQDIDEKIDEEQISGMEQNLEKRAEKDQTYPIMEKDVEDTVDKEQTSGMEQDIEEKIDEDQISGMEQNLKKRAEKDQTYPIMETDIDDTVDKEQTSGMEQDIEEKIDEEQISGMEQNLEKRAEKEQTSPGSEQDKEEKADQEPASSTEQNLAKTTEKEQTCVSCEQETEERVEKDHAPLVCLEHETKEMAQRDQTPANLQQEVEYSTVKDDTPSCLEYEIKERAWEKPTEVHDDVVPTENTASHVTAADAGEQENKSSVGRQNDEVIEDKESQVHNMCWEHPPELTDDLAHMSRKVRFRLPVVQKVKCGDRLPLRPLHPAKHFLPAFLHYNRTQLLHVSPAPLTSELVSHLQSLGIAVCSPKKRWQRKEMGDGCKLKYNRSQLLQVAPALLTPEVTSHLRELGIAVALPRRRQQQKEADSRQKLKTAAESRQPDTMPSSGPPQAAGSGGSFSCFLCEAEGFTAWGMEQHLELCHKEEMGGGQGASYSCPMCSFSTSSPGDCQNHIDTQHPESSSSHGATSEAEAYGDHTTQGGNESEGEIDRKNKLPPMVPETSSALDDIDDAFGILETSLRLNDCPSEGDWGEPTEDLNNEDDVNGEVDGRDHEAPMGDDGAPEKESNLSVILKSVQNAGGLQGSQDSHSTGKVTPTNHGGARPKVRPNPPCVADSHFEMPSHSQASGGGVDHGARRGEVYTCPFCSFSTRSEGEIHSHVNDQHLMEEEEEEGAVEPATDILFLYTCPFCANGFDTPKDLSNHINTDHPEGASTARQWSGRQVSWGPNTSPSHGAWDGSQCVVCGVVVEGGREELSLHVDQHFASSSHTQFPQANPEKDLQVALQLQQEEDKGHHQRQDTTQTEHGMDTNVTAKRQFDRDLERAVFNGQITSGEFHSKKIAHAESSRSGVDDGSTQVSGVVEQLRQYYDSRSCPRTVARARLCSSTHYYSGSFGDKGWGCGYRNLQMLLSCLMNDPTYLQVVFCGKAKIPSILKLQQLIESAWQKGFDPQGCQQLGSALANTRKWIGATEIVALLSSLRVKCELLDFVKPSGPNSTHPVLLQWVREYFTSGSTFTPPLYLQHQGHSRTIVGIEELSNGNTNLLLFDPGVGQGRMLQFQDKITYNLVQTVRKTVNAFKARQYQIVAVVGVLDDQDFERSKKIHSKRMS